MNRIYEDTIHWILSIINFIAVSVGLVSLCKVLLNVFIEFVGGPLFPNFESLTMLMFVLLYMAFFDFLQNSKKTKLIITSSLIILLVLAGLKHESYFWGSIFVSFYILIFLRNWKIEDGEW